MEGHEVECRDCGTRSDTMFLGLGRCRLCGSWNVRVAETQRRELDDDDRDRDRDRLPQGGGPR